jgi:ribosomal-protein-alanine N-acetyltransferase
MTLIETPRLIMRPFEASDAEEAFAWFGDPQVMKYVPTGPDLSIERTQARLAGYLAHQAANGFSKWVVIDRTSGRLIGDAGLLRLDPQAVQGRQGWIDLGFRFLPHFWGKGLATEAAQAWVDAAFARFRLSRLVAIVHPDNAASLRVVQKVGFRQRGRETVLGMPCVVFDLAAGPALDPLIVEAAREVDGTLLDWALSLSPRERLRACTRATAALGKFADATSSSR